VEISRSVGVTMTLKQVPIPSPRGSRNVRPAAARAQGRDQDTAKVDLVPSHPATPPSRSATVRSNRSPCSSTDKNGRPAPQLTKTVARSNQQQRPAQAPPPASARPPPPTRATAEVHTNAFGTVDHYQGEGDVQPMDAKELAYIQAVCARHIMPSQYAVIIYLSVVVQT
jgi:hypothetical protein